VADIIGSVRGVCVACVIWCNRRFIGMCRGMFIASIILRDRGV
jgi:hypothetical protein